MTNTNYPIGDFLVRIKNTALARKHEVRVVNTKLIESVAKILKEEGLLKEVKREKDKLVVRLVYRKKQPLLLSLKIVSRPGLRIYMGTDELAKLKQPSFFILSTPKGVMTSREAIKKRLGGEIIAEVL